MSALSDYARGNLGREWGRPHSLERRRFNFLLATASWVGAWLICMALAGAAFFIVTTPFLGTILRFLDPPAAQQTAAAPPAAEAPRRAP